MLVRKAGLPELMTGQAPKVHPLLKRIKPWSEFFRPFPLKVDKLGPPQTGASHRHNFFRKYITCLAKSRYPCLRELQHIAPPADMQSRYVPGLMGQQYRLAVGRFDDQGQPGARSALPVGMQSRSMQGRFIRRTGFRVRQKCISVYLMQL